MVYGQDLESEEDEPQTIYRKSDMITLTGEEKTGKNIAMVGLPDAGKTIASILWGFFNSKYKKWIKEAGYDGVVELLNSGVVPEVEKIVILETENYYKKIGSDGIGNVLFKPLLKDKVISVQPIIPDRRDYKIDKDGRMVDIKARLLMEIKQAFQDFVDEAVKDYPETTLFIIDSMSGYKKLIDDNLGLVFDHYQAKTGKGKDASVEAFDSIRQAFYAQRNTWWNGIMQKKRGYEGWQIDTYKLKETPDWVIAKEPTRDIEYELWVAGTEHDLDMIYTLRENKEEGTRTFDAYGRQIKKYMYDISYPQESRMGAMPFIEIMSEILMLGEQPEEELDKYWGI